MFADGNDGELCQLFWKMAMMMDVGNVYDDEQWI